MRKGCKTAHTFPNSRLAGGLSSQKTTQRGHDLRPTDAATCLTRARANVADGEDARAISSPYRTLRRRSPN